MTTFVRRLEKRWLQDPALQALTLDQVKAFIDALALAMYADFHSDDEEDKAFASMMLSLPCDWAATAELAEYAVQARVHASAIKDPEEVLALAIATAARIPPHVRTQAFEMMAALTIADRELDMGEAAVLTTFGQALGFDEPTTVSLYEAILDALGLEQTDDEP